MLLCYIHALLQQHAYAAQTMSDQSIIVVSGLPRSGTSLMMNMLQAGGIEVMHDGKRRPDAGNPTGYFEHEKVKELARGNVAWLAESTGKAIKIVSPLLAYLPDHFEYKVVFLRRSVKEIVASQEALLEHMHGAGSDPALEFGHESGLGRSSSRDLRALMSKHLRAVQQWRRSKRNVEVQEVRFEDIFEAPHGVLREVEQLISRGIDLERAIAVINPALARHRRVLDYQGRRATSFEDQSWQ